MSAEIRVLVPWFDVSVGVQIRLGREKIESPALLCDPSHRFGGEVFVVWLRYDEHQSRRRARPSLRWDAHDAGFVDVNHQRFHVPNLTHGRTLPSFYVFGLSPHVAPPV
jgi:hypothetical protein